MKAYLKDSGITGKIYKGFVSNRRFSVFLICLFISIICWIFTSLNKTYQGKFVFRLNYINRPFLKNITSDMPKSIVIEMEARGFDLIAYSFRQKIEEIDINVGGLTFPQSETHKTVVVPLRNILNSEITGMQADMVLKRVSPEYLSFDFSTKFRKKVPVVPFVSVSYKKQYYSAIGWIMKPDSVEISGSQEALDKVSKIEAESVNLVQLDHRAIIPMLLQKNIPGVDVSPEKTWLYIPVEEIAEERIRIPVEISNGKEENSILLPDKVTIIYQASIENIDKINTDEFRVCADVTQNDVNGALFHKVTICHTPPGIYKAWIESGFVKYLTAR